jgi:ATP phosphoribosyltransferase regulatory subunit
MFLDDRWLLPEGIEEILPEEADRLEQLRRDILTLFAGWGYRLVIPPFIEFLDSLLTGTGRDLELQTFKLTDQISGKLLGVRADMTPQVARIDAYNLKQETPARLCYLGTVLHTQSDHLEKSRSPMQVGAELYGHAGYASDLEIIQLTLEMLAIAGVHDLHMDLGHVGIYRGLARQAGLTDRQEADLFDVLQRKAQTELSELLDRYRIAADSREMLLALAELNGDAGVLNEADERLAAANEPVKSSLRQLAQVADALTRDFPSLPINFDLAELRAYHYQTGIVFAVFVPGYGREVARGGRYDDIGKVFGRARPATGFSADLKVLLRLSSAPEKVEKRPAIFAPFSADEDLRQMIRVLRAKGHTVIQELPGQNGDAAEMGCSLRLARVHGTWEMLPTATTSGR